MWKFERIIFLKGTLGNNFKILGPAKIYWSMKCTKHKKLINW